MKVSSFVYRFDVSGDLMRRDSPWDPIAELLPIREQVAVHLQKTQMDYLTRSLTLAVRSIRLPFGPTPTLLAALAGPGSLAVLAGVRGPRYASPTMALRTQSGTPFVARWDQRGRIGTFENPRTVLVWTHSSWHSSISHIGNRLSVSRSATRASSRARAAPMQK